MKVGCLQMKVQQMQQETFDAEKIGEIKGLGILKSNISKLYASKDIVQML